MDEEQPTPAWRSSPPTVAAVLVTHNGGRWLPQVLGSYAALEHAPTVWRVVDVSSVDDGAEMVRASFGEERVTYASSGTGFGAAVALAVEAMPRTDWLWLLHDDAVVAPGALAALLDEATAADDVAVVGPKIREWPSLRRLLEVGLTVTTTGARETGLETGEPDAGQHDWPRDVLAVNTAGMLVRRDVWDELGGLDPDLPLHYDDVDLRLRAARAGYRTRIAPDAVVFHAEASRRGTRRRVAGDREPWEVRRAALHTMLANAPRRSLPWQYVRLLVGTLLRTLGLLLARDPEAAGDELQALAAVYGHPRRLREARRRRAPLLRRDHRDVKHLFAPFWLPYRHGYDAARDALTALVRPETVETSGRRTLGDQGIGDEELDDGPPLWRRRPWLVTVLVLTVLALVASRGLLVGPPGTSLVGGSLAPTPDSAGGWWSLWFERSHDVGLGSTAVPPTLVLLLAAAATPLWFAPEALVTVLVLMSPVLAGLTAHRLGRRITGARGPRIVWAVGYGMAVAATGAIAQGRIGTLVALVVLPVVAGAARPLVDARSRRAVLRLGIWTAVGAAFAPVLLPLVLVGLATVLLVVRDLLRPMLGAAVVSLVLLGPWFLVHLAPPTRLWWEAGYPVDGAQPGLDTAIGLLLGRAGGPGEAPLWLGAGLVVLALLALVPRPTRVVVALCWALGLAALLVAVLGVAFTYTVPGSPVDLVPWVGVPVVAWVLALGTAVLVALPEASGLPRPATAALLVLALLLPVGTAAWWTVRGVDEPLDRGRPQLVPAFLTQRPGDTLIITGSLEGGVGTRVISESGPVLGAETILRDDERQDAVVAAVETLLARPGTDDVAVLASSGIDAVYAPDADPELARRLDAAPGLEPSGSEAPTSRVWTIADADSADRDAGPLWRPVAATVHALLWLVAILLTTPVQRRRVEVHDDEEVTA